MAAAIPYAGYDGKVLSGANDADVYEFNASVETKEVNITTTSDAGWGAAMGTTKNVTGNFKAFYNVAKRPFGATMNLSPGYNATPPVLHLKCGGGDELSGPAMILKCDIISQVEEVVRLSIDFRSAGIWTVPT